MEEEQILQRMVGRTIERVEKYESTVLIWFTDGEHVEIESKSTEQSWLTLDGDISPN